MKGLLATALAGLVLVVWMLCGRSIAAEAVYPIENGRNWFSRNVVLRVKAFFSRAQIADENRKLKLQVASLQMVREDAERIAAENARLRRLLGDDTVVSTNGWVYARVLSRDGTAGCQGILRVGKGSLAGVKVGAAVAVPDGLVGRVSEVSLHTATVRLITDPDVRVSCEVETNDPSLGAIYGILYGGKSRVVRADANASLIYVVNPFRIRHIKRDYRLPVQARVVTSGLGGVYPRGIPVGYLVEHDMKDSPNLEQSGDVMSAVDFPALEDVFIRCEK